LRLLLLFRLLFLFLLPSTSPRRIVLRQDARGRQVGLAFELGLHGGVHVLSEDGVGSQQGDGELLYLLLLLLLPLALAG